MCKVSIICPVFNASRYLARSVGSVLGQTFGDFELILVDDGSTDGSDKICDDYAAKDGRIKVIHKPNGGVSSARQSGLDAAKGTYIGHLDPDDWIDEDFLEKMYGTAVRTDADMVCCPFCTLTSETERTITPPSARSGIMNSLCNKLIKRSVYERYGLFFPEVLTTAEDAFVVFSARIKGVSSEECNEVRYYYDRYSNTASLTRSKIEKSLDSIKTCIGMLEKVEGREDEKEYLISWMKEIAKTKAFYALPTAEYMDLYKEINKKYIARNIFKITNVEAYAALALIIRNSDAAMKLFRKLKSLKHRQD